MPENLKRTHPLVLSIDTDPAMDEPFMVRCVSWFTASRILIEKLDEFADEGLRVRTVLIEDESL